MKTRLFGYVRVSTEKQADFGISLAEQKTRIAGYCVGVDAELVDIGEDAGLSGKNMKRPGLQSVLARMKAGEADGIIVVKLCRLARNLSDASAMVTDYFTKYTLVSMGDHVDTRSAQGRLMLHFMMSIAQWERESTSEKVTAAMAELKRQGVTLGSSAYGWTHGERPEAGRRCAIDAVPHEVAVAQRMEALASEGLGVRAIAAKLTSEGVPSRKGGAWHPTQVQRILARGRRAA